MRTKSSKALKTRIRVLLCSKYPLVWQGLKFLIESDSEIIVVGTHTTFDEVPNSNEIADAEVAVVDISRDDRLEMISDLLGKKPGLRVVVIVDGNDLDSQAIALKLGAVGIVMKERSPRMLFEAIRQTHKGETWLNQVLLGKILERNRTKTRSSGRRKSDIGVDLGGWIPTADANGT